MGPNKQLKQVLLCLFGVDLGADSKVNFIENCKILAIMSERLQKRLKMDAAVKEEHGMIFLSTWVLIVRYRSISEPRYSFPFEGWISQ